MTSLVDMKHTHTLSPGFLLHSLTLIAGRFFAIPERSTGGVFLQEQVKQEHSCPFQLSSTEHSEPNYKYISTEGNAMFRRRRLLSLSHLSKRRTCNANLSKSLLKQHQKERDAAQQWEYPVNGVNEVFLHITSTQSTMFS